MLYDHVPRIVGGEEVVKGWVAAVRYNCLDQISDMKATTDLQGLEIKGFLTSGSMGHTRG